MATSRRRERELARRRFERRRQAELERRAAAKRRNTVLGAVIGTVAVIVVLVIIGISIFGGSSKKPSTVKAASTASPAASPTASAQPAPKKCAKISPNPPVKGQPRVPDVTGKAPTKLVTKDITVGHGRAAQKGDSVQVDYIGVSCSTGKVFDSTYAHQPVTPLPVTLGSGGTIAGFDKGLAGIRTGGLREIVVPAKLAYADEPSGAPTFANDTLIFLLKAVSVKKAA